MSINNLNYSKSGFALTKLFEGYRANAYQDSVGVWTIGYGHTAGVHPGMVITELQAETFLTIDVHAAEVCVNQLVKTVLEQDEFDALVDFVFNLGSGKFAASTLLKDLNAGNFAACHAEFLKWDHAGTAVNQGLFRRRTAEANEFDTPPGPEPAAAV